MRKVLHHLFFPKESNNYRAKLLHPSSLLVIIVFCLFASLFLPTFQKHHPEILGVATNISTEELVALTNQKRIEAGLAPLTTDGQLTNAALQKAQNMLAKGYWAHNGPDGTTPWVFIANAGYKYVYAGENLARGFDTSSAVVDAWIASQSHKENLLSPNYTDVGFAVLSGTLTGDETVLVVQMFGNKTNQKPLLAKNETLLPPTPSAPITTPVVSANILITPSPVIPTIVPTQVEQNSSDTPNTPETAVAAVVSQPLVNAPSLAKNIAVILLGLFIVILFFDMLIVKRNNILRAVGHNIDHILFLTVILLSLLVIGSGVIL
ncbi:MAG TPA: CAP domain-containing protein [Patescibacteria group bacterium]|nr:CAP domain-containing protein [Patescibacteria group bacterium]